MSFSTAVGGRLGIAGTFECRDAAGNLLKTIELRGAIPLEDLGLTVDEARQLVESQEQACGPNDRERGP